MTLRETDEAVYSVLSESGLRGTKVAWPLGEAPSLPWFTYKRLKKGEVFADDRNYAKMQRYQVDLYQSDLDDEVVERLEAALDRIGPHSANEVWNAVENCWITSYTLTYHPE